MLKQRLALITGGSRGIGLACGHKFASEGYSVLLVSRSKEISEIAGRLPAKKQGQLHAGLFCDITDSESVRDLFKVSIVESPIHFSAPCGFLFVGSFSFVFRLKENLFLSAITLAVFKE